MGDVLPIFPLSHVLLPCMALPLHIFEPRYRQMLVDVTETGGHRCFGIVSLTRGIEVGTSNVRGEPEYAKVGTVAEILEIEPYPDGASDLFTGGSRRFRILNLVDGKPYLQAEVEYLDEPTGPLTSAMRETACVLASEHARLVGRLTGRMLDEPFPDDAAQLSYHLAEHTALAVEDKQALLGDPTAAERLQRFVRLMRREIPLLRQTRTIAVAPGIVQLHLRPN